MPGGYCHVFISLHGLLSDHLTPSDIFRAMEHSSLALKKKHKFLQIYFPQSVISEDTKKKRLLTVSGFLQETEVQREKNKIVHTEVCRAALYFKIMHTYT